MNQNSTTSYHFSFLQGVELHNNACKIFTLYMDNCISNDANPNKYHNVGSPCSLLSQQCVVIQKLNITYGQIILVHKLFTFNIYIYIYIYI